MNSGTPIRISEKTKITAALSISIVILCTLGIFSHMRTLEYKASMHDFNESGITIAQSQDLMNAVVDVQSAYRNYIFTNDSIFLKSFEIANLFVQNRINSLKKMPIGQQQLVLLDSISKLVDEQKKIAYDIIVKQKYSSLNDALRLMREDDSNTHLRLLKYNIQKFINKEKLIQSEKLNKENKHFNLVIDIVIISVVLSVLIILFTLFYVRKIFNRLINTERLLLKSQLRLERILDQLPVGVIIANANNNEYHANYKAVTLLGNLLHPDGKAIETPETSYTFKTGLGHELSDQLFIRHAIQGEENIGFNETTIEIADQKIPFRVSAIPLYNEKGTLEYAVSVFDDISNIKKFEQDLIEAKKLVEESLQLKASFLSNMSHEIRTPINAILGFAELLQKKDMGEQENEYVRIISSAGEGLLRLLNDILDFSKLESNMMVFEDHPVSIDGILNSICNLYLPKARNKGIALSYECSAEIPEVVVGDPVRLTQVITNIVGNAIKFTPKGSILIDAKLISLDKIGLVVEFRIKDSGIGISKNKLSRVFKRFEQAGTETTRLYGGTGLGLSIAKHIVQSRGGEISVTSELGVGSIFTFTMPFKIYTSKNFANTKLVETVTSLEFLNGLKILLVEDNLLNVKLIHGIFMGTNVNLDVAETGAQTLKKLKENQYEIVLMDIELPDMSGYQITNIIRSQYKSTVPIIALTAHALAGEKEKCFDAGMNDYLTKPVNTKQLFEKIYTLVASKNGNDYTDPDAINEQPSPPSVTSDDTDFVENHRIIDLSYVKEFSDGNKAFEREMIELFLNQAPPQLEQIEKAIEEKNYKDLKMAAHKLKSSVAIIMGDKLTVYFELLEDHALNQDLSQKTSDCLTRINEVIAEGVLQLEDLLKTEYTVSE